jgi:hypothetical protein
MTERTIEELIAADESLGPAEKHAALCALYSFRALARARRRGEYLERDDQEIADYEEVRNCIATKDSYSDTERFWLLRFYDAAHRERLRRRMRAV